MDGHWLIVLLSHPLTLVGAGSAAGGIARYLAGTWVAQQPWAATIPWGTFFINVAGSFLLGLIAAACQDWLTSPAQRRLLLLAGTGFCGGFTTFSTYSLEVHKLLAEGRPVPALGYALGSVACGLAGAAVGFWVGRWALGR